MIAFLLTQIAKLKAAISTESAAMAKYKVVFGTMQDTASSSKTISLPSGFTRDNCVIIGAGMMTGSFSQNIANLESAQDIHITINSSNKIQINTGESYNTSIGGKTLYVLLLKIA